jgi:hypothetical protein
MTQPVGVVRQALLDKGMQPDDTHHHMFRKTVEGTTRLVTRISHDAREIDDHLGGLMAKQLCLQLREFWRLVECTLSEAEWDDLVRARCEGGRNPFLRR